MVDTIEKIPKLHMICGEVDGGRADLQNLTLFYFMRTTDAGVPAFDSYKECLEEITRYLIVGSIQGKFLLSLNKMLVQVAKQRLYYCIMHSLIINVTIGPFSCSSHWWNLSFGDRSSRILLKKQTRTTTSPIYYISSSLECAELSLIEIKRSSIIDTST